jgi:hypothetical protein
MTLRIILEHDITQRRLFRKRDGQVLVISTRALPCDWYAGLAADAGRRVYHYRNCAWNGAYSRDRFSVLVTTPNSLNRIKGVPSTFNTVIVDTIDELHRKLGGVLTLKEEQKEAVNELLQSACVAATKVIFVVSTASYVSRAFGAAQTYAPDHAIKLLVKDSLPLAPLTMLDSADLVMARLESAMRQRTADCVLVYSHALTTRHACMMLEEQLRQWLGIRSIYKEPPLEPEPCTVLSLYNTFVGKDDDRLKRSFARDPAGYVRQHGVAAVLFGPDLGVRFEPGMFTEAFVILPRNAVDTHRTLTACRIAASSACIATGRAPLAELEATATSVLATSPSLRSSSSSSSTTTSTSTSSSSSSSEEEDDDEDEEESNSSAAGSSSNVAATRRADTGTSAAQARRLSGTKRTSSDK